MSDISFDTCKCGAVIVSSATAVAELKAENERLRAALALFACDCAVNERCAVPDNCRNLQARRTLGERT